MTRCGPCELTPKRVRDFFISEPGLYDWLKNRLQVDAKCGDCANFAVALGRIVGSKDYLLAYMSPENQCSGTVAHVYLRWKGKYWDVDGPHDLGDVEDYFRSIWGSWNFEVRHQSERQSDEDVFLWLWDEDNERDIEKWLREHLCKATRP